MDFRGQQPQVSKCRTRILVALRRSLTRPASQVRCRLQRDRTRDLRRAGSS